MYLKKVHIQNIKSIKDFEMEFDEPAGWHVLIGDNGSGKSTIVKSIALGLIGKDDWSGINEEDWNIWLRHQTDEAFVDITFQSNAEDLRVNRQPVTERILNRNDHMIVDFVQQEGRRPSISIKGNPYDKSQSKGYFSASFGPYRRFENGSGEWETIRSVRPRLAPHLSAFKTSATFPHTLTWIQRIYTEHLENPSNTQIKSIEKLLGSPDFLPNGTRLSEISSKGVFFLNDSGAKIPLSALSDGYRSVLALTLELIHQLVLSFGPEMVFQNFEGENFFIDLPGVVLIDEIDVHLHPSWQLRIGEWFLKYFTKIQFIVTTHSPLICRASEKGSIWHLKANNSEGDSPRVSKLDYDRLVYGNILDAYGTELFGASTVRSQKSNEKLERLGRLNLLAAFGKITADEEKERHELQLIMSTDDPFGA
jgi:predicted ATPase